MKEKLFIFIALSMSFMAALAQIPTDHMQLWLRADSIELIDGKVATIYDLSGNDYSLAQIEADKRPVQVLDLINTYPGIRFDGINDFCQVDFGQAYSQPFTVFVIYRFNGQTSTFQFVFDGATTESSERNFFYWHTPSNTKLYFGSPGGTSCYYERSLPTEFQLNSIVFNSNSSSIYENGILQSHVGLSGGTNNISDLTLGTDATQDYWFKGDFAELIMYDTVLLEGDQAVVEDYLMDKYSLDIDIGPDISVNYGFCDTMLIVDNYFSDIIWSTGETNDTIFVNQTSEYTVQAKDIFGRIQYDTIYVQFPNSNIQNSIVCLGDSILYEPDLLGSYSYLWSDLTTDATKYYKDEGAYWLIIEDDNLCFDTVFFNVEVDSFKNEIWLGNDTSLCSGNIIQLITGEELCSSFLWTPGSNTESSQIVSSTGWQKLEVENSNGCTAVDSIYVTVVGTAPTPDYIVENLCFGDTTQFIDNSTPLGDISSWKWIINYNDTIYTQNAEWVFETTGPQQIELIVVAASGCIGFLEFEIDIKPLPEVSFSSFPLCIGVEFVFLPDILLPDGTTATTYEWLVNDVTVSDQASLNYTFTSVGEYKLEFIVGIDNTCYGSHIDTIDVVDNYPLPNDLSTIFPYNNYCISNSDEIEFQWNVSDNAVSYAFYLASDANFENILVYHEGLTETELTLSLPILVDTLFWMVKAYNPCMEFISTGINSIYFFNPDTISNLSLWLVADSVGIVDGQVASWYDLSDNNIVLSQESVDNRPTKLNDAINNKPSIIFDGINDYLIGGDILNLGTASHTFFIVSQSNAHTGAFLAKSLWGEASSRYNLSLYDSLFYFGYNDDNVSNIVTNEYPIHSFMLIHAVNDRLINANTLFINSDLKGSNTIIGSYNMNSAYSFLVGATNNYTGGIPPGGMYLNGEIAEIIIFDTILNEFETNNVYQYLRHKYAPPVNLQYDIRVPYGFCDTAITTAYKPWFTSYEWSTGETDSIIHVNRPSIYTVTVTDIFGFESSDDIRVFYPEVNEFTDTLACLGETLIWDLELAGDYTYEWYGSGETTQSLEMSSEGQYAAILTDTVGCQYKTDTINFNFDNYELTASVGPEDTTLCAGNRLFLVSNADETTDWEWSTASTSSEIVLSTTGEYSVTTTNWRGCQAVDTINVTINGVVPVPAFESLGQCAQNPVSFTDLSTSSSGTINSWEWFINGVSFSTEQNPQLETPNSELETFEITLEISTDDACGDFITNNLTVYPLPTISFTPQIVCQNSEIEFTSTSNVSGGTIINDDWDFGSSGSMFTEKQLNGSTVKQLNSSTDFTLSVVEGKPLNRSTDQPTNRLTDQPINRSTITHTFVTPGYHTVQLISTTSAGCVDSAEFDVYVKPAELPVFSTENTCLGVEVYFVNETEYNPVSPVQSMEWDFGDESSTSSESSPVHIYEDAGTYDASLDIVYSNGCELQSTQQVEVYYKPEIEISGLDACIGVEYSPNLNVSTTSGNISNYRWEVGSPVVFESFLASPSMIFDQMGSYPFSLTVGSDVSCEETVTDTIYVRENPLAAFSASRTWGAIPLWVDFTNTSEGAEAYYWQFDEENFSSEENPYFVFQDSGTFIVELRSINEYGCYDTETMIIKSVVPLMDIILYSLRTEVNDNYLTTSVYIINNGTLPVDELNLDLNLGNGQIYRETIEDFQSGQVMDYTFTFKAYLADGELPELVCVEAVDPVYGIYTDVDIENNTVCNTNVQNLMVFQPFPNPVSNQLICEFITANAEDISITLVNSLGEIAYKNVISSHLGYKKFLIDVYSLSQGVYYLQISTGEEKVSFKVEINR